MGLKIVKLLHDKGLSMGLYKLLYSEYMRDGRNGERLQTKKT